MEGPGKVDLFKVGGKMLILGCTTGYETGAKYLKTGKQRQVARRLRSTDLQSTLDANNLRSLLAHRRPADIYIYVYCGDFMFLACLC